MIRLPAVREWLPLSLWFLPAVFALLVFPITMLVRKPPSNQLSPSDHALGSATRSRS